MRLRRFVVALALVAAGCGVAPAVVVRSSTPLAASDPAPPLLAPSATRSAPTTALMPTIGTHDATLGALPTVADAVPVAVDAGPDGTISGPVVGTGVDPGTGELAVPADAGVVAWYEYGPAPGDVGSAVLAGHVDWHGVPGIFFRLRE